MKKFRKAVLILLPALIPATFFIVRLRQWYANADKIWTAYESNYGSFTADKTYSYDNAFYAVQEVELHNDVRIIRVCIYEADTDTLIYSFCPARARDFWGICWESDTYNLWTQSADIGIYCYKYDNNQWIVDKTAVRPPDIISKYDDI